MNSKNLHAAELLQFHFNNSGANIVETTPWISTNTFDPGVRPFGSGSIGLTNGPGLSQLGNADIWGGYATMKPNLTEAIATRHYAGFTVQAAANKALFLNGGSVKIVTRSGGSSGNQPEFIALLSSVNGFTDSEVLSVGPWVQGQTANLPITGAIHDNLTEPVEFRLYIYRDDASATGSAGFRLAHSSGDTITLNGTIDTEINLTGPSSLVATATSLSQIDLSWNDLTANETGYQLERSPNGIAGWSTLANLPAGSTTYSDTSLLESTAYYYRVKATAAFGQSQYSPTATATTFGDPPDGATGLSATALTGTKIRLDWIDQAANETGFKIERAISGGAYAEIATVPANTTTYLDRDTTPGTLYQYRLIATNVVGDSDPSPVYEITTPVNSTVNFLIFGNSYSHFYEYLPSIAASRGDAVNIVAMRNSGDIHTQLQAEQDGEDGLRTLPSTGTSTSDGFSPLETSYSTYVRMKDILDQQEWDFISFQPHSSWANKLESITPRADGVRDYFSQPQHEPSAEILFYHTTQYQNDEHLFRNLVNTSAHSGTLRGNLPYTEDQHTFDALAAARLVKSTYGFRISSGGIAQQNLRYDPRWGFDSPDPYFDYFNASSPEKPTEPANRRLHHGFRWASDGTSNNPKFAWEIDSHPHVLLNYLTACLWYETLFRKDVRPTTFIPAGVDEDTAALIRDVAHRTAKGELPPLRLADQPSRTQYGDILWESATALLASTDPDSQQAGHKNLATLRAYFPEHAQAGAAATLLDAAGMLHSTLALAAREVSERPLRESIYQKI